MTSRRDDYPDEDYYDDPCPGCDSLDTEWVDCFQCGGEGGFDNDRLMEEDPLWYDGVDWEQCGDCCGYGGWIACNDPRHTEIVDAKRAAKPEAPR